MADDRNIDPALSALISQEINAAVGWIEGELSEQRRRSLMFYLGEPLGNEIDGRSKVVCSEVSDTVEWIMPALMDIFMGGDDACSFAPQGPEDEAIANEATEYINWIFLRDNPGFLVTYSAFKDALIQKNGIIKGWWEKEDDTEVHEVRDVDGETYAIAAADPDIEIIPESVQTAGANGDMSVSYNYRNKSVGRCRVMGVPPEEFLIDSKAREIQTARFVGHRIRKTVSDLIEEGYPEDLVNSIPDENDQVWNQESMIRDRFTETVMPDVVGQGATREKWIVECYLKYDSDGDGIAERRKVTVGGTGQIILDDEPWDGPIPFVSMTPIIMPHRFFGISIADLVMDLQIIKSTILRQILDNMYQAVNSRLQVSDQVNLDDLLVSRPGGIVRLKNGAMPSQGHILPVEQQLIISSSFPLLEYLDTIRENRTGVTRYNQGIDANSLNKTASGITQIMNAAQQRMKLIARVFAETGYKDLMWLIMKTVSSNQSKARVIRLRNGEWKSIDPREWENKFDLVVNVGIGTGDKQQQLAQLMQMIGVQTQAIQMQGGADGPIVTLQNIYNSLAHLPALLGRKGVQNYFTDPSNAPKPAPKPPDPAVVKAQADAQVAQTNVQIAGLDLQGKQIDLMQTKQKAGIDMQQTILDSQVSQAQAQTDLQQTAADAELAKLKTKLSTMEALMKFQLEKAKNAQRTYKFTRGPDGKVSQVDES